MLSNDDANGGGIELGTERLSLPRADRQVQPGRAPAGEVIQHQTQTCTQAQASNQIQVGRLQCKAADTDLRRASCSRRAHSMAPRGVAKAIMNTPSCSQAHLSAQHVMHMAASHLALALLYLCLTAPQRAVEVHVECSTLCNAGCPVLQLLSPTLKL